MCACETGVAPVGTYRGFAARAAVAVLFAALGGCASDQYASSGNAPVKVAAVKTVIDLEDDGMPAQTPPPKGTRYAPDDPAEPYSRNYGGINPSASSVPAGPVPQHEHVPVPNIPNDLPPAFRKQLVTAMTADE